MNIIDQQLKLDLGENYKTYRHRTEKYCNTVISIPPLKFQRNRILNNEGGIGGLIRTGLLYVIEKDDLNKGLKAFRSYLDAEYNFTNNRSNVHHTKVKLMDQLPDEDAMLGEDGGNTVGNPLGLPALPSREGISLRVRMLKNPEEEELFQILSEFDGHSNRRVGRQASYGQLQQAFQLLGWEKEYGMRVYHRVKQRARSVTPAL